MGGRKLRQQKDVLLKSSAEIAIMLEANQIVADILYQVSQTVQPGISTAELDSLAEELTKKRKAQPAFKGYYGFPAALCVSINDEVVHGIPSPERILQEGDCVSVDFGVKYRGFFGDAAVTVPVGKIDDETRRLLDVTRESLDQAITQVVPGNRIVDISRAVQKHAEGHGYSVVRQFVGHGIGSSLHEGPEVPNFVRGTSSMRLLAGMVLAIEPMVNTGTHEVTICDDGWTVVTADHKPSAHFEHSVAVTENGPLVLSSREPAI